MNANLYVSARQSLRRFARVAPLLASAMFAGCGKTQPALYVMKDLHPFINPRSGRSTVVRKIKDTLRISQPFTGRGLTHFPALQG